MFVFYTFLFLSCMFFIYMSSYRNQNQTIMLYVVFCIRKWFVEVTYTSFEKDSDRYSVFKLFVNKN